MKHEYRYDRWAAWLPGLAGAGLVAAAGTGAALQTGGVQILLALVAALAAIGLLGLAPLIFDRRVQLSVGPDGLFYRPFSPQIVAWSDITAVAVVRTTTQMRPLTAFLWRREMVRDAIHFDVANEGRLKRGIPLYRTSAKMTHAVPRPLYPITVNHLQYADAAVVVSQIKRYWKGAVLAYELHQQG